MVKDVRSNSYIRAVFLITGCITVVIIFVSANFPNGNESYISLYLHLGKIPLCAVKRPIFKIVSCFNGCCRSAYKLARLYGNRLNSVATVRIKAYRNVLACAGSKCENRNNNAQNKKCNFKETVSHSFSSQNI